MILLAGFDRMLSLVDFSLQFRGFSGKLGEFLKFFNLLADGSQCRVEQPRNKYRYFYMYI